jgi:hypothetical protein
MLSQMLVVRLLSLNDYIRIFSWAETVINGETSPSLNLWKWRTEHWISFVALWTYVRALRSWKLVTVFTDLFGSNCEPREFCPHRHAQFLYHPFYFPFHRRPHFTSGRFPSGLPFHILYMVTFLVTFCTSALHENVCMGLDYLLLLFILDILCLTRHDELQSRLKIFVVSDRI